MDERLEGIRFIIESKLEDVIALTQIVATEVLKVKPKNEYWHIYNYLECLLKTRQCKDAVEKRLGITKDAAVETEITEITDVNYEVPLSHEEEHSLVSEEELAALKIQMTYRAHKAKSKQQSSKESVDLNDTLEVGDIYEQEQAALKIQKAFREHNKRQLTAPTDSVDDSGLEEEPQSLLHQDNLEEQEQAAIKIQRAFRGTREDKTGDVEGHELKDIESEETTRQPNDTSSTPKRKVSNQRSRLSILSSWLPDLVVKRKTCGNINTHEASPLDSKDILRKNTWPTRGKQKYTTPSPTLTPMSLFTPPNISLGSRKSLTEISNSKSQLENRNSKSPQISNVLDTLINSTSPPPKQRRSTPGISKTTACLIESEKFRSQPQISSLADGCLHIKTVKQFPNPASITYDNVKTYSRSVDKRNNICQKDDNAEEANAIPPAPPSSPRSQSELNDTSAETLISARQRRSNSNNKSSQ